MPTGKSQQAPTMNLKIKICWDLATYLCQNVNFNNKKLSKQPEDL
jgi:hypothetical protein